MPTPLDEIDLLVPALLAPTHEVCVRRAVVGRIERRRGQSKEDWKLRCTHYSAYVVPPSSVGGARCNWS